MAHTNSSRSLPARGEISDTPATLRRSAHSHPCYFMPCTWSDADVPSFACRIKSEEKFEDLEKQLDSESGRVADHAYLLAKSRLPVDSPYVGNFHRYTLFPVLLLSATAVHARCTVSTCRLTVVPVGARAGASSSASASSCSTHPT
jgi:hypothetical protein